MAVIPRVPLVCVLACASLASGIARADESPPGATAESEARALFDRAIGELKAGHFAVARDLLERSAALADNQATLFNLGVACRGTGETLRAAQVFEALLSGEHGALSEQQRREVQRLLSEVRAEIGRLSVTASGAPEIELRIDGRHVGDLSDGDRASFPVDPGERVVSATAAEYLPGEQRVRVERGGRLDLAFELQPRERERSLWESPLLWGAAGVLAVSAVVVLALAAGPSRDEPVRDPVYGVVSALRVAR
jgi:hypothetical protein